MKTHFRTLFAVLAVCCANFAHADPAATFESEVLETTTPAPPHYIFTNDKWVEEISTHADLLELVSQTLRPIHTPLTSGLTLMPDDQLILIMFYADWCPHCHRAAPVWNGVANLYHCTPGIRFFAFECSQSEGRDGLDGKNPLQTCMEFGVKSFPTFYAFSAENLPAELIPSEDGASQVVEYAESNDDMNVTTSRLVFDNNSLEFSGINVTEPESTSVVLQQQILIGTRSVSSFRNWITALTRIKDVRRCVLQSDFFAPTATPLPGGDSQSANIYEVKRWDKQIESQPVDELYADALNALLFLLRNWAMDSAAGLTSDRNRAVRNILGVGGRVLPGANVRQALLELAQKLQLSDGITLPPAEYLGILADFEIAGLHVPTDDGSYPQLYHMPRMSSALWLFFHIMSAGYYVAAEPERAALLLNATAEGQPGRNELDVTAWDVANGVRDLVTNFFACDVCRVHFLHFFDGCYAGLCEWVQDGHGPVHNDDSDGLLLWLWRFHNAVSFRTAVERTADAVIAAGESGEKKLVAFAGQDIRFPPLDLCRECHAVDLSDESAVAHANLNPAEFTVSHVLLDQAVAWEKMVRGIDVGDFNSLTATGGSVDDLAWDRFEDFDLSQTEAFLLQRFWKSEWLRRDISLRWQTNESVFSQDQLRHLTKMRSAPSASTVSRAVVYGLPLACAATFYLIRSRRSRSYRKLQCQLWRSASPNQCAVPESDILA